jgi:alkylhydroperoxidase/carboxymuconolactone decarboxylase family protein YurZ
MSVRRQVLGDEHVDRAVAATTAFSAPFQDLITRYAWGEVVLAAFSHPARRRRVRR